MSVHLSQGQKDKSNGGVKEIIVSNYVMIHWQPASQSWIPIQSETLQWTERKYRNCYYDEIPVIYCCCSPLVNCCWNYVSSGHLAQAHYSIFKLWKRWSWHKKSSFLTLHSSTEWQILRVSSFCLQFHLTLLNETNIYRFTGSLAGTSHFVRRSSSDSRMTMCFPYS